MAELIETEHEPGPAEVDEAEATLALRLVEAELHLAYLRSVRRIWLGFAICSWLLVFATLIIALWPYFGAQFNVNIPLAISYVSAFVVVLATAFALISSYRVAILASLVARVD